MRKQNIQLGAIAKRAERYLKENDALLRKHRLAIGLVINFPRRRRTPLLSRFALWFVTKQGGLVDMQFSDRRRR